MGESLVLRGLGGAQAVRAAFIGNRLTYLIQNLVVSSSVRLLSSCGGGQVRACHLPQGSSSCQPHFFCRQMFQDDCVCFLFCQPAWNLRALDFERRLSLNLGSQILPSVTVDGLPGFQEHFSTVS